MDDYFFQHILEQNVGWLLPKHRKMLPQRSFILKPIERTYVRLKTLLWIFKKSPPFEKSACFYVTNTGKFSIP